MFCSFSATQQYRPPSSTASYWNLFSLNISKVFFIIISYYFCFVILMSIHLSNQSTRFKQILQRLKLHILVNAPADFTTPEGMCIDLLVTCDPASVRNIYESPPFCSIHSVIGIDLQFCLHKQYAYRREIVNYNNSDFNKLDSELANIQWDVEVFNSRDIDEMYSKFTNVLNFSVDKWSDIVSSCRQG